MADVKRGGALKEVLDLAGELANKMATISIHVEVGPDPRGETKLLEQWRAAHQAVAVAHNELSRLADKLAASTNRVTIISSKKGGYHGLDG